MDRPTKVRAYADGRICLPPQLLRTLWGLFVAQDKFRVLSVPRKALYIAQDAERHVYRVSWEAAVPEGWSPATKYDLSVRDRVLFGAFQPGKEFPIQWSDHGTVWIAAKGNAKTKAKVPTFSIEDELEKRVRQIRGSVLRDQFPNMTLADVAKACPGITVGEILGNISP